jgi:hypothetical protein
VSRRNEYCAGASPGEKVGSDSIVVHGNSDFLKTHCFDIRALIKPGLARADSDGLPCYLETFQERHLAFYEEHGFQIAGAGCIPDGPNFWTMIRTSQDVV